MQHSLALNDLCAIAGGGRTPGPRQRRSTWHALPALEDRAKSFTAAPAHAPAKHISYATRTFFAPVTQSEGVGLTLGRKLRYKHEHRTAESRTFEQRLPYTLQRKRAALVGKCTRPSVQRREEGREFPPNSSSSTQAMCLYTCQVLSSTHTSYL